jgi:hypothetical protein
MKRIKRAARTVTTAKDLRAAAREFLRQFIRGESSDVNRMNAAIGALHAPTVKGD